MYASAALDLAAVSACYDPVIHGDSDAHAAVGFLIQQLHDGLGPQTATLVVYFASSVHPAEVVVPAMAAAFPDALLLGCSTAGEFGDQSNSLGGISALAFTEDLLDDGAAALGELTGNPILGTDQAIAGVEAALGTALSELDPEEWFGLVLIDGLSGAEEIVNERLAMAAAELDIVGGSAADDLAQQRTWVSVGEEVSYNGVALVVARSRRRFQVVHSAAMQPTGRFVTITSADPATRVVHQFNHRPAVEAYADLVGCTVAQAPERFIEHPLGVEIDGLAWVRSPARVTSEGGLAFHAQLLPGMSLELLTSNDLIGQTSADLGAAIWELDGRASTAVVFNGVLRRLEMDTNGWGEPFRHCFAGVPTAGFHSYGESWLGHANQTLTGIVFG